MLTTTHPQTSTIKSSQSSPWLNDEMTQKMCHYISKYNELPKSLKLFSDDWKKDNEAHTFQMWPDQTNLLYKAKEAFIDFSNIAPKIFENFEKVNIFDLYHTNGYSCLPMVMSLFVDDRLEKYVPITATKDMAQNAINSIKQTIMLAISNNVQSKFNSDMIRADIEKSSFRNLVKDVVQSDNNRNDTLNVYVLGENSLGNLQNPELFLKNIYDSMQLGEKLLIMQAIYRPGVEDLLVEDYIKLMPHMTKTIQMAQSITTNYTPIVSYNDVIGGITLDIKLHEQTKFGYLELEENKQIRIFRSMRFKMNDLHDMFHRIGFALNYLVFDTNEDNAVILLSK